MASLYGEELIHEPKAAISEANQFLQLGLSVQQIAAIVESDESKQDAKVSGQRFSVQKREETYRSLESFYGAELEQVYRWMLNNNPSTSLNPRLSASLR